jgi:hypothetical protein
MFRSKSTEPGADASGQPPTGRHVRRMLILAAALLFTLGCWLRVETWQATAAVRFTPDLNAAWHWGERSAQTGFINLYDAVVRENPDGRYLLDYVPLRLLVAHWWVRLSHAFHPGLRWWTGAWSVNAPLLLFHGLMELMAAAAAFALVRLVLGGAMPGRLPAARIDALALLAATAIWLNPALLINSHGRPGTDVWILPFYLWAMLAAFRGRWWLAGFVVAIGAMLKGQQMIVAPVFVLWALFARRPVAALRWALGAVFGLALCAAPWLLTASVSGQRLLEPAAVGWTASVLLAAAGLIGAMVVKRRLPAGWAAPLISGAAALALFLNVPLFGARLTCFQVGLGYGAAKYAADISVGDAMCLAGILEHRAGLQADDAFLRLGVFTVTARLALFALYGAWLTFSGAMLARLARWGRPMWLAAIALPWLAWFAFAPQMHERYLLFGAACACLAVVVDRRLFAIAVLASATSWLMTVADMVEAAKAAQAAVPASMAFAARFSHALHPDFGWVIIAATVAYAAVVGVASAGARSVPRAEQDIPS